MKKKLTVLLGILISITNTVSVEANKVSNTSSTVESTKTLANEIERELNKQSNQAEVKDKNGVTYVSYETGIASHYGGRWNGRKTANGEIFDTTQFTAAHKTLPFNSKVRVTNLSNGKSVIVRINDRGPYVKGRVIDLSQAAFSAISNLKNGIAKIKIELIK